MDLTKEELDILKKIKDCELKDQHFTNGVIGIVEKLQHDGYIKGFDRLRNLNHEFDEDDDFSDHRYVMKIEVLPKGEQALDLKENS